MVAPRNGPSNGPRPCCGSADRALALALIHGRNWLLGLGRLERLGRPELAKVFMQGRRHVDRLSLKAKHASSALTV